MKNKTKKNYIVEVEFKNGSIGKYRTALMDNGDIQHAVNDVVNLYRFRNDKGGQTFIDAKEVLVVSIYEDEGKEKDERICFKNQEDLGEYVSAVIHEVTGVLLDN